VSRRVEEGDIEEMVEEEEEEELDAFSAGGSPLSSPSRFERFGALCTTSELIVESAAMDDEEEDTKEEVRCCARRRRGVGEKIERFD
jgi:hypothetical protein